MEWLDQKHNPSHILSLDDFLQAFIVTFELTFSGCGRRLVSNLLYTSAIQTEFREGFLYSSGLTRP